ncbi:MAG: hypothetical protein MJ070_09715, partial [Lachnospiraceae bacterium]|nr:hypothetical protein [Lachnospiraceae bacterium]
DAPCSGTHGWNPASFQFFRYTFMVLPPKMYFGYLHFNRKTLLCQGRREEKDIGNNDRKRDFRFVKSVTFHIARDEKICYNA